MDMLVLQVKCSRYDCSQIVNLADGFKQCSKCREYRRNYYNTHIEKASISRKTYYTKNKESFAKKARKSKLKNKYGLTEAEFAQMLETQKGKCAICQQIPDHTLRVDHNHKTGKNRALLCLHCNSLLGYAKEEIQTLERAIQYLQKDQNYAI